MQQPLRSPPTKPNQSQKRLISDLQGNLKLCVSKSSPRHSYTWNPTSFLFSVPTIPPPAPTRQRECDLVALRHRPDPALQRLHSCRPNSTPATITTAAAAFALFFGRAFWANRRLLAPAEPRFSDPELQRLLGHGELGAADRADAKARRTRFGLAFAASLVWLGVAVVFLVQHGLAT